MGLLNHDEPNNQSTKHKLNRGAKVVVQNQVERNDVVPSDLKKSFPVNVRVDNHIRNQISALINLGKAKSQKELVQKYVEHAISALSESESSRFDKMFDILEQKDDMKTN